MATILNPHDRSEVGGRTWRSVDEHVGRLEVAMEGCVARALSRPAQAMAIVTLSENPIVDSLEKRREVLPPHELHGEEDFPHHFPTSRHGRRGLIRRTRRTVSARRASGPANGSAVAGGVSRRVIGLPRRPSRPGDPRSSVAAAGNLGRERFFSGSATLLGQGVCAINTRREMPAGSASCVGIIPRPSTTKAAFIHRLVQGRESSPSRSWRRSDGDQSKFSRRGG